MSKHLKEIPPAAVVSGREIISVDASSSLPHDRTAVTTRLDATFVKRAALGRLTAPARLVKQDERSALAEAELVDSSGQIVARVRAELSVRPRQYRMHRRKP